MKPRPVFHLSIPVIDLQAAKAFYIGVLGAVAGRENEEWLDVLMWGHQITLQRRPEEVLPLAKQGKRHFGVTLPWEEWESQVAHVRSVGARFMGEPAVLLPGTRQEHGKFYLADPSNNIIEVKAYRDMSTLFGAGDDP